MADHENGSEVDVVFVPHLLLDSGDPEFIRGCEVGRLQARVDLIGEFALTEVVRQSNAEMLRRIAAAAGREFDAVPIDDNWLAVTIHPGQSRDELAT